MTRADFAGDRWADEGGSFDRDADAATSGSSRSQHPDHRERLEREAHAAGMTGRVAAQAGS